jgi:hypothetical protein
VPDHIASSFHGIRHDSSASSFLFAFVSLTKDTICELKNAFYSPEIHTNHHVQVIGSDKLLDSRRNTTLLTLSNVTITAKQQQTISQGDINQPSKIISMSLQFTI